MSKLLLKSCHSEGTKHALPLAVVMAQTLQMLCPMLAYSIPYKDTRGPRSLLCTQGLEHYPMGKLTSAPDWLIYLRTSASVHCPFPQAWSEKNNTSTRVAGVILQSQLWFLSPSVLQCEVWLGLKPGGKTRELYLIHLFLVLRRKGRW